MCVFLKRKIKEPRNREATDSLKQKAENCGHRVAKSQRHIPGACDVGLRTKFKYIWQDCYLADRLVRLGAASGHRTFTD
jgi:hypothetical protein